MKSLKTKKTILIAASLVLLFAVFASFKFNLFSDDLITSNTSTTNAATLDPSYSDINSDGIVDIFDLSILLSNWGVVTNNNDYVLVRTEDFNGTNVDSADWYIRDKLAYDNHQGLYMAYNTSAKDGSAIITTRRHCVSTSETNYKNVVPLLTEANTSTKPCASGLKTFYSTGKIDSKFRNRPGKIEIRAKMPVMVHGLWPALWLRNEVARCDLSRGYGLYYGELDINETYSEKPNVHTSSSHMGCPKDSNSSIYVSHSLKRDTPLWDDWHIWTIEYDEEKIVYKFDGEIVKSSGGDSDTSQDTASDFMNAWGLSLSESEEKYKQIMDQGWQVRIETQVLKAGGYHPSPDPTKDFPIQEFAIDYIKYYEKPPLPEEDSSAPTTPTNVRVSDVDTTRPSSEDPIRIDWGPSTDNVGIKKYVIFRNNRYEAATTNTYYIDYTAVKSGCTTTCQEYRLYAEDYYGNRSPASPRAYGTVIK